MTQTKPPPENPGRFNINFWNSHIHMAQNEVWMAQVSAKPLLTNKSFKTAYDHRQRRVTGTSQPTVPSAKYPAFRVGALPAEKIGLALGVELEAGDVWVSKACHEHIARDHPSDYDVIIAAIFEIVAAPLYVGQDPKNARNFYVVRVLPPGATPPFGLVAIGFERNEYGGYNVRTAYSLSQDDVDSRRAAKRLHSAI